MVICFICSVSSLEVISPSLSGTYQTPSCDYNINYIQNENGSTQNNSTLRDLIEVDFDFCSEYEGEDIPNIENVVLFIDYYNCFASQKAYNAHKAGATQVVIRSYFPIPGPEVHVDKADIDIFALVMEQNEFLDIQVALRSGENVTVIMHAGKLITTPPSTIIFINSLRR